MAANKVTAVHGTLWIFPSCDYQSRPGTGRLFFFCASFPSRVLILALLFDGSPWRAKLSWKGRGSMEDIAARRAAEKLLAQHRDNVAFKRLGPPDGPKTISDAYDIQERYVALLRGDHGDAVGYKVGLTSAANAGVLQNRSSHRRCRARQPRSIDQARACGARISAGSAWNSKSPSGSSQTSRLQAPPLPPRWSRLTSVAFARPSNSSTIEAPIIQSRCSLAACGQFLERRHRAVGICD